MRISVVIPLYNKEAFIRRAIESVLHQSHEDLEIIVVDDGSTDNSAHVVKDIQDPRLRLITQENRGVSAARNIGAKASRADWVAFLDADDEYEPGFLASVVEALTSDRDCPEDIAFIGANYYLDRRSKTAVPRSVSSGLQDYFKLFVNNCSPCCSSSTVVNKRIFHAVGGFSEGQILFEDWLLWFKLALAGHYVHLNTPLALYHSLDSGSSARRKRVNFMYSEAECLVSEFTRFCESSNATNERTYDALSCMHNICLELSWMFARNGKRIYSIMMLRHIGASKLLTKHIGPLTRIMKYWCVPHIVVRVTIRTLNAVSRIKT